MPKSSHLKIRLINSYLALMWYSMAMNSKPKLEELLASHEGKKLLLLGKEGLFERTEIERFLKPYKLTITDTPDSETVATIEPAGLNPVEEMMSEQAYEMGIPSYDLQELEELINATIDDDALLMAIKLGNDQSRIKRMLANPHLSDSLFVRLLKLYDFDEEEEDSRDDRDVIMYTLRRYIAIKPNEEDLLYSYLTLRRLATEARDPNLLEALLGFPNFEFLVRGKERTTLRQTIAGNPNITEDIVRKLLSYRHKGVDVALAGNSATDASTLNLLHQKGDPKIAKALAINPAIDNALFEKLLEEPESAALALMRQPIDSERLSKIQKKVNDPEIFALLGANEQLATEVIGKLIQSDNTALLEYLSANPVVPREMLEQIYQKEIPSTLTSLAKNPNVDPKLLERFYEEYGEEKAMRIALAYNPTTPTKILEALFNEEDLEINRALATNRALPMELLDILKLDTRLQNELAQNENLVRSYEEVLNQGKVMLNV